MNALTSGSLEKHFAGVETRSPLNVVIAYDGISAAQHALDIFSRLTPRNHTGGTTLCASTWWFKFLEDPNLRAQATAAVANADVLVIAANREFDLPNGVESWLERTLAKKRRSEFAVVALAGKENRGDKLSAPWFRFVRRVTREAGACFFAPFGRTAGLVRPAD